MRDIPLLSLLAIFVVGASFGCGANGAVGSSCTSNRDCNAGLFCSVTTLVCTLPPPEVDSGTDAGPLGVDSSVVGSDSDVPGSDMNTGGTDSAVMGTDSTTPGTDAAPVCVPSTTSCNGGSLETCNASGTMASAIPCPLGCVSAPSAHCGEVAPSNGLDPAMADPMAPSLIFNTGGVIDTSACTVVADGNPVAIPTTLLSPGGGAPDLCVLLPSDMTVAPGATVVATGVNALAVLSATDIDIGGFLDASATLDMPGPGGSDAGPPQLSGSGPGAGTGGDPAGDSGGGGAGFCGSGGVGGAGSVAGGAGGGSYGAPALTPLFGGSGGGGGADDNGVAIGGPGGAGGGAVHLAALGDLFIRSTGGVHTGGGGGTQGENVTGNEEAGGGGGSGGAILLEAANVTVEAGGVLAAAGGGGGAPDGAGNGDDGPASTMMAAGGAGVGGVGSSPGSADGGPGGTTTLDGGGGGGAAGWVRINSYLDMPSIDGAAALHPTMATGCVTTGAVSVQ